MLDAFIHQNHATIVARTQARVAARTSGLADARALSDGIPAFLDQLAEALHTANTGDEGSHSAIRSSAGRHGLTLLGQGISIAHVVHAYGDVCQVVTDLAGEQGCEIAAREFGVLNLCLDDAIAEAVSQYARRREQTITEAGAERIGVLAHEMRNHLNTAVLAFDVIANGVVATRGSTSAILSRSLLAMSDLVASSLADVRLAAGIKHCTEFAVADFLEEVEIAARLHAETRGVRLLVQPVDTTARIEGDRIALGAAVSNLLHNAFKFTRRAGLVTLRTEISATRVAFSVEDECGGLPPGKPAELFRPFRQAGSDRTGVGLGLAICNRAAELHGGELRVVDLPGKGCVFTLEIPRVPP